MLFRSANDHPVSAPTVAVGGFFNAQHEREIKIRQNDRSLLPPDSKLEQAVFYVITLRFLKPWRRFQPRRKRNPTSRLTTVQNICKTLGQDDRCLPNTKRPVVQNWGLDHGSFALYAVKLTSEFRSRREGIGCGMPRNRRSKRQGRSGARYPNR